MGGRLLQILLVEDNAGDVRLTEEAFKESKIKNHLNRVKDGVDCIAYLRRQGAYARAVRPDLILLDLNLPRKDGREVLAEIKSDSSLRRIPVIVLTTSDADEDVMRSYDNHANCYIKKPVDLNKFIDVIQKIEKFWFTIVELPKE